MEETKKMRTLPEINKDYSDLCMRAGDLEYKRRILEVDLNETCIKINALDKEALEIKKANEKPLAAVEPITPEAP